jgi:hypothetical protein
MAVPAKRLREGRERERGEWMAGLELPSTIAYVVGAVIMLVGVVVPIGWFVLKNKASVSTAWSSMGKARAT